MGDETERSLSAGKCLFYNFEVLQRFSRTIGEDLPPKLPALSLRGRKEASDLGRAAETEGQVLKASQRR